MRVFGIDCGTECTGYGVVDLDEQGREARLVVIDYGGIRLPRKEPLASRLLLVHVELSKLIERHQPDFVAVEEVFHSVNAQSALKLGHVRGVALLAAAGLALPVVEYAPLKIKSSVTGFGLAKKEQVQYMVSRLLRLPAPPEPADAADALAIAICHLHHAQTARNQGEGLPGAIHLAAPLRHVCPAASEPESLAASSPVGEAHDQRPFRDAGRLLRVEQRRAEPLEPGLESRLQPRKVRP